MKQELTWGAAAAVAIVAAIGISTQSGSKPPASTSATRPAGRTALQSKLHKKTAQPQCIDSISLLEHFFLTNITAPNACYALSDQSPATNGVAPDPDLHPSFIIATLPDPLHTHFSLLFDRLIEGVQQAAQDEGYDYDSSWLPWDTEEPSLALLPDQDEAEERKSKREDQPGILLFRNTDTKDAPYKNALIVFIVGEEPTRGIHRPQFENAVAWMSALQKQSDKRPNVAVLGPTFSGSFSSLQQLLSAGDLVSKINGQAALAIYSGSASSGGDARQFARTSGVDFRSFTQDDQTALTRLCRHLKIAKFDLKHLAVLSEDETAYGYSGATQDGADVTTKSENPAQNFCDDATRVYYPRDISTLRAAYQSQSMFSSGTSQQNQDSGPRKSLPTDLADPSGQQHDTVRAYAGNQASLSQEAQLLGIVDALRVHRAQYIVIRSSNTLDPLFLANFLRRDYPEARVVILNADLLFQRGQDAMALSGVMVLSTYPLFPWARDWTALQSDGAHSHRVFPETSTEGTYIASRLLLQSLVRADDRVPPLNCEPQNNEVFVPPLLCQLPKKESGEALLVPYAPLPDYAPPFWTESRPCGPGSSDSCRPATWLSVITRNGTWPLAALNDQTLWQQGDSYGQKPMPDSKELAQEVEHWPSTPRSMKMLFVAICGLALFHAVCCGFASFTAKPAFRAHFATAGRRHTGLVLICSYLIALLALLTGWGCGIFSFEPSPPISHWGVGAVVLLVCVIAALAMVLNIVVIKKLNGRNRRVAAASAWRVTFSLLLFFVLIGAFFRIWVQYIEGGLLLATRAFSYLRAMNLTSGVCPIVPFLSLIMGLYLWSWYALHGLALFGPDRPCLPLLKDLRVKIRVGPKDDELKLSMFSQENAGTPAELLATPLAWDSVKIILILFVFLALLVACLMPAVPVRSLNAKHYAKIFCFSLDFYFSLILAEACQIWRTWSSVRQLLVFLDRLALRRTLGSLHGFSWGSVWKMSGNVLDVRYKLLSRQLECLTHLHNSLNSGGNINRFPGANDCVQSINATRLEGMRFAQWYSKNFDNPAAVGMQDLRKFQKKLAETTGVVLTQLLVPASRLEKHSLIQVDPNDKRADDRRQGPAPSANELIRNAEELVCLTYLGYAQNLLGRIRTIVLGGVYLFLAVTIAVSSYPFDPRPLLSGALLFLFFAFGGVVVLAYADMHRDATLSHLTNTNPGELGSEFWFKVVGLGAAPLLGLITQIFPEWSGFLFSWLQPGLSSLK